MQYVQYMHYVQFMQYMQYTSIRSTRNICSTAVNAIYQYMQYMLYSSMCSICSISSICLKAVHAELYNIACIWAGGGAGRPECQAASGSLRRPRAASRSLKTQAGSPLRNLECSQECCSQECSKECWIWAHRLELAGKLARQADWTKEGRRKMDERRSGALKPTIWHAWRSRTVGGFNFVGPWDSGTILAQCGSNCHRMCRRNWLKLSNIIPKMNSILWANWILTLLSNSWTFIMGVRGELSRAEGPQWPWNHFVFAYK